MMPPCIFTAYSGYKYKFNDSPTDYNEIYVYSEIDPIKKRFPQNKFKLNNIYILKIDSYIQKRSQKGIAPLSLIYVDLWNLNTWYANDFLKELEKKLRL